MAISWDRIRSLFSGPRLYKDGLGFPFQDLVPVNLAVTTDFGETAQGYPRGFWPDADGDLAIIPLLAATDATVIVKVRGASAVPISARTVIGALTTCGPLKAGY